VDQFVARLCRYRDDARLRGAHGQEGLRLASQRSWPRQVDLLIQHYTAAMDEAAQQVPGVVAA
jgi:hypothetical protein